MRVRRWRHAAEDQLREIDREWHTPEIDDEDTLRFSIREHTKIATLDALIAFIEGPRKPLT